MPSNTGTQRTNAPNQGNSARFVADPEQVSKLQSNIDESLTNLDTYWRQAKAGYPGAESKAETHGATAHLLMEQRRSWADNKPFDPSSLAPTDRGASVQELTKSRTEALNKAERCMTKHLPPGFSETASGADSPLVESAAYFSRAKELQKLIEAASAED